MFVKVVRGSLPGCLRRNKLVHVGGNRWKARSWIPDYEVSALKMTLADQSRSIAGLASLLSFELYQAAVAIRVAREVRQAAVLDAGCGENCLYSLLMASRYQSLFPVWIGVDIRERVLRSYSATARNFVGVVGDLKCLDFVRDESLDLVICAEVVEHMSEAEGSVVLEQLARVVRPGRWMLVTTPLAAAGALAREGEKFGHKYYWESCSLAKKFASLGLVVEDENNYLFVGRRVRSKDLFANALQGGCNVHIVEKLKSILPERIAASIIAPWAGPVAGGGRWLLRKS